MSNLPGGAFLTSIDGRTCTGVPRNASNVENTAEPELPPTTLPRQELPPAPPVETEAPEAPVEEEDDGAAEDVADPSETIASPPAETTAAEEEALPADGGAAPVTSDPEGEPLPSETPAPGQDAAASSADEADEETNETEAPEETADTATAEPTPSALPSEVLNGSTIDLESTVAMLITDSAPSPEQTSDSESGSDEVGADDGGDDEEDGDGEDGGDEGSEDGDGDGDGDDAGDDTPTGVITTTLADGIVTTIEPGSTGGAGAGLPGSGSGDSQPESEPNGPFADSSSDGGGAPPTGIIVGSVVGAVAALAVIGLLIWFVRRRSRRERYVIQTPTFSSSPPVRSAKTWEFDTGSVGPTPRSARIVEAVGHNFSKLGMIFSKGSPGQPGGGDGSVDMDRGNSQYLEDSVVRSRNNSSAAAGPAAAISKKDKFSDWWTRLAEDANFNWGVRHDQNLTMPDQPIRGMEQRQVLRNNSIAARRASEGSSDEFMAALGVMWQNQQQDPFSDKNAIPAPLRPGGGGSGSTAAGGILPPSPAPALPLHANPFHDSQAIPAPTTTYDPANHRRRSRSSIGSLRGPNATRGALLARRDDSASARFLAQRAKVQSDQFDLELEARGGRSGGSSVASIPERPTVRPSTPEVIARLSCVQSQQPRQPQQPPPPPQQQQRTLRRDSYSSQISDGVSSVSDWGDPGPVVGQDVSAPSSSGRSRASSSRRPRVGDGRSGGGNISPGTAAGVGQAL